MRVTEQQLRTVVLAQAIEHADTERTLLGQAEIDDATRSAIAAARGRGVPRVDVGDIVLDRAATLVARAGARNPTVAALQQPSLRLQWLASALPVLALLLGLALDRIANAHRVDLLSPPLLLVLAWNLAMYALLAWRAVRRPGPGSGALPWLRDRLRAPGGRAVRKGLAGRIAVEFQRQWLVRTAGLFVQRAACVLHLCAAAWAAGIALSLLLRGLVVRYQFGWESTFLDAGQVHAIVSVLFWPLTGLFGLAPFSPQDIAATQNFAGEGVAGSRWVWMYVGLLALVVVLPRLALAAWTRWRARQLSRHCRIDLDDGSFDALRRGMPGDLVVGLCGGDAAHNEALLAIVAWHAQQGAVHSALGDRLRFTGATGPAASQPVDAVLQWADGSAGGEPRPPAWQTAPVLALRWSECAESWVLEPALFEHLGAALPRLQPALQRLRLAWVERNEERFEQSLQALVQHLRACAAQDTGAPDYATRYEQQVHTLDEALRALHGQAAAQPAMAQTSGLPMALPRTTDGTALALGTSAGAAAGAAAGAKVGALIDVGSGGMTLGAGTALGALLGGTTAWVLRGFQKKGAAEQVLLQAAEAACLRYLVIAHQDRVLAQDAAQIAQRWRAEVTGTVAAHEAALAAALGQAPAPADPALPLLRTLLRGILQRSFPAGPGG